MRLFITGATGEIGEPLLRALVEKNSITALTTGKRGFHHPRLAWVQGDLNDLSTFATKLAGCDALIHMAAETRSRDEAKLHQTNVNATAHLVEAAHEKGIKKIIVFSSASVTQNVHTPYAKSKIAMEKRLEGTKFPIIVVRPTFVYCEGSRYLQKIAQWAQLPLPFIPYANAGRARIDPIHVNDLIAVIQALLADKAPSKSATYDLASPEKYRIADALDAIQAKQGTTKPILDIQGSILLAISRAIEPFDGGLSKQFNAFGVLGESYHVNPLPIIKKYDLHFTNPTVEIPKCLRFLEKEN